MVNNIITLKTGGQTGEGIAIRTLKTEHQAVCQMLNVLEKSVLKLELTGQVPLSIFDDVLEFLTVFVDRCHHTKEEEVLFPLMVQSGLPAESGPISVMLAEHRQGRELIARFRENLEMLKNGNQAGQPALIEAARAYCILLREHIQKENRTLFVLANTIFDAETQQRIYETFEEIEINKLGAGTHERLHGVIEHLVALTAAWPGGDAGPDSEGCSCSCAH
jgi:hemerythrin-like domain-containing protein